MKITAERLRKAYACGLDIAKFEEQWPEGCKITRKNCKIAFKELGLDASWAAANLLSVKAWNKYQEIKNKALSDYMVNKKTLCQFEAARIKAFYQAAK